MEINNLVIVINFFLFLYYVKSQNCSESSIYCVPLNFPTIKEAVDQMSSGGELYIDNGNYSIDTRIDFPSSIEILLFEEAIVNITLDGMESQEMLNLNNDFKMDGGNGELNLIILFENSATIYIHSTTNTLLSNFNIFDYTNLQMDQSIFDISDAEGFIMENINYYYVNDNDNPTHLFNGIEGQVNMNSIYVRNCKFFNIKHGVIFSNAKRFTIESCYFEFSNIDQKLFDLSHGRSDYVMIKNNVFDTNGSYSKFPQITYQNGFGYTYEYWHIQNNFFNCPENHQDFLFDIGKNDGEAGGWHIANNIFYRCSNSSYVVLNNGDNLGQMFLISNLYTSNSTIIDSNTLVTVFANIKMEINEISLHERGEKYENYFNWKNLDSVLSGNFLDGFSPTNDYFFQTRFTFGPFQFPVCGCINERFDVNNKCSSCINNNLNFTNNCNSCLYKNMDINSNCLFCINEKMNYTENCEVCLNDNLDINDVCKSCKNKNLDYLDNCESCVNTNLNISDVCNSCNYPNLDFNNTNCQSCKNDRMNFSNNCESCVNTNLNISDMCNSCNYPNLDFNNTNCQSCKNDRMNFSNNCESCVNNQLNFDDDCNSCKNHKLDIKKLCFSCKNLRLNYDDECNSCVGEHMKPLEGCVDITPNDDKYTSLKQEFDQLSTTFFILLGSSLCILIVIICVGLICCFCSCILKKRKKSNNDIMKKGQKLDNDIELDAIKSNSIKKYSIKKRRESLERRESSSSIVNFTDDSSDESSNLDNSVDEQTAIRNRNKKIYLDAFSSIDVKSIGIKEKCITQMRIKLTDTESLKENEILQFHEKVMTKLEGIVFRSSGTIDNFSLYQATVSWNSSKNCTTHVHNACGASLKMKKELLLLCRENGVKFIITLTSSNVKISHLGSTKKRFIMWGECVDVNKYLTNYPKKINKIFFSQKVSVENGMKYKFYFKTVDLIEIDTLKYQNPIYELIDFKTKEGQSDEWMYVIHKDLDKESENSTLDNYQKSWDLLKKGEFQEAKKILLKITFKKYKDDDEKGKGEKKGKEIDIVLQEDIQFLMNKIEKQEIYTKINLSL